MDHTGESIRLYRVLDGLYGCGFLAELKKHLEQDVSLSFGREKTRPFRAEMNHAPSYYEYSRCFC
jgi:hypothetical protein